MPASASAQHIAMVTFEPAVVRFWVPVEGARLWCVKRRPRWYVKSDETMSTSLISAEQPETVRSCLGADKNPAILVTYICPTASARNSEATAKKLQLKP